MDRYITGAMIRRLRERAGITQQDLAQKLSVSDKAISRWETGRGYPDITLVTPLAQALGVSVIELFSGGDVTNRNRAFHMPRLKFYVCPVCGNIILGTGEAVVSCCGITLPPLEPEAPDEAHGIRVTRVEDEYCVELDHEMRKTHFISFVAAVRDDGAELRKLYPEGSACVRFRMEGVRTLYFYCNRHGLMKHDLKFI